GNRRVALLLAVVTAFISVAAVHVSQSWFSPGLLILPVLAGGLLLWPPPPRGPFVLVAPRPALDPLGGRARPPPGRTGRVARPGLRRAGGQGRPRPGADDRGDRAGGPRSRPDQGEARHAGAARRGHADRAAGPDPGPGDAAQPARWLGLGVRAPAGRRLLVRR